jgi:hypothetical protein
MRMTMPLAGTDRRKRLRRLWFRALVGSSWLPDDLAER